MPESISGAGHERHRTPLPTRPPRARLPGARADLLKAHPHGGTHGADDPRCEHQELPDRLFKEWEEHGSKLDFVTRPARSRSFRGVELSEGCSGVGGRRFRAWGHLGMEGVAIATHPIFIDRMAEAIQLMCDNASSSFDALDDTERTMRGVLRDIKYSSSPPGAPLFARQAHWISAARLPLAQGSDEDVRRHARRAARWSSLFLLPDGDICSGPSDDLISVASRQLRQTRVSIDLAHDEKHSPTEEDRRLFCQACMAVGQLVLEPGHSKPRADERRRRSDSGYAEASAALWRHWAPTFARGPDLSPRAAANFLQLCPGAHCWSSLEPLTFE